VMDETLVEPVCQASLIQFGRRDLLFSNPAAITRTRMTVRRSRYGGKTWKESRTVYDGPAAYSSLVELKKRGRGQAGLLYERGDKSPYERIVFETMQFEP
jgi:sialidase-1